MPLRLLARAASHATGRLGWARSAVGALLGIAFAAGLTRLLLGGNALALPWLVAPLGASAVLVFALPASPLAQPWPVFGGNMLSAAIGLACAHLLGQPLLACAVAVGLAIAAMGLARCLHPPGGACALVGALGGPAVAAHGPLALLGPLAINIALLLAAGWLYNNLTGHAWPHRMPSAPSLPPEGWTGSYDIADLEAVLEDWDEVLDVSPADLDALFRAVERRVQRRWQDTRPR
ncbi:MAG: HPP family protein [Novosphingobium sp.]|nr:HPP family protein [Novosphingobium sp.]